MTGEHDLHTFAVIGKICECIYIGGYNLSFNAHINVILKLSQLANGNN